MGQTLDFAQGVGLFSEAYANGLIQLPPKTAKLYNMIPFEAKERQPGSLYHQPVIVTRENGTIFNSDGSAFTLTDPGPQAAVYADAQIRGTEICHPSRISYGAISRAVGGVKQFVDSTKAFVVSNSHAMAFALELSLLYGQTSIGATSSVTASGTTGTLVFTAATWAPGIWVGSEGRYLDVYQLMSSSTPTNSTAAVIVSSVTFSTRTVNFTCNSSDAAALDALTTAFVFRRGCKTGATSYNEFAGLDAILTTTTGNLFNVSTAYSLWQATSYDCGSASLTMQKIQMGLTGAINRGLEDDVVFVCSPATWADVMSDLAALRMFDSSYASARVESGSENIKLHSQNGVIEFVSHILCKEGEAFAFPKSAAKRIGSTEPTYRTPGVSDQQLLLQLPQNAGWEFRSYTDQALFINMPATCVKFTGIVNTT